MIEMVCAETKIPIRAIAFPFTALALDCCRKVMLEPDLDAAYSSLLERYHTLPMLRDDAYYRPRSGNVIITLCMSGGRGGPDQAVSGKEGSLGQCVLYPAGHFRAGGAVK